MAVGQIGLAEQVVTIGLNVLGAPDGEIQQLDRPFPTSLPMRKSVGDSGQKAQPAAPGVVDDALFHRLIQINRQRGFLQRESRLVCGGLDGVAGKVGAAFLEAAEDLLEELLLGEIGRASCRERV